MKRLTTSAAFTLARILLLYAGMMHGGCPSGTIHTGRLCYKWHAISVPLIDAMTTCSKEGGHLAGFKNKNFLETIQKNPLLEEYLPKGDCCWAILPAPSTQSQLSILSWFMSGMSGDVMDFSYSAMCYDGREWIVKRISTEGKLRFVCEYDVDLFKRPQSQPKLEPTKAKMMSKVEVSGFVTGQLVLEEKVQMLVMCGHLCDEHTGCSVFNYNKVTKQCQGFGEMKKMDIENHKDWEVWVFE